MLRHALCPTLLLLAAFLFPLAAHATTLEPVPVRLESALLQAFEDEFGISGSPASTVVSGSGSVALSWDFAAGGNGGSATASVFEDAGGIVFEWSGTFTRQSNFIGTFFVDGPITLGLDVPDFGASTTPLLFRFTRETSAVSNDTTALGLASVAFAADAYQSAIAGVTISEPIVSILSESVDAGSSGPSNLLVDMLGGDTVLVETGEMLDGTPFLNPVFQGGQIKGGETLTWSQRMRLDVFAARPTAVPEPAAAALIAGAPLLASARRLRR